MNYRKLITIPQKCVERALNHHLSWLGVAAALPLFGMVTAFAIAPGSQRTPAVEVEQVVQQLALPAFKETRSTTRYWREEPVRRGDSLARLLNRLGVGGEEARRFLSSSPLSQELMKLKSGATLSVETNDAGELFGLRFLNDDENGEQLLVVVEKVGGEWRASADEVDAVAQPTMKSLTIDGGVAASLAAAQVPAEVRTQLAEIFSDRFELSSLKSGDRVAVVYDTMLYQGSPVAVGNVLAAEVTRGGKVEEAYYFAHDSESGAYYDHNGDALKQGFGQQPVAGARISSGFGFRRHPVLHTLRMHAGVDYAAPTGTPIHAPADGVVTTAETQNGYGNVVMVRHKGKLTTVYGHMSRFAAGMRTGKALKAGDLIGYVGSTGRSTGPHLHFEVRVNEQPVDPSSAALPNPGLSPSQKLAFREKSDAMTGRLAMLRSIPVNVAQLD
ncbi:M23 family metallopeptidase [Crenobacter cavernae]|uniref:M23 family metallopeptidase n=1 Tax=Crenobacter cavernae TaxID=2290923 RepID=A0ABY0FD77_9NEIS|nr:M23 family metallopeptidase [Crenobacter cavernae]RXZ42749.1 M23 family metallopeptidase [Crenobacter cavernae]